MPTLKVAEYRGVFGIGGTLTYVVQAPPIAKQNKTLTVGAAVSLDTFHVDTKIIGVAPIGASAYLEFGTSPTADADSPVVCPVGQTTYIGITSSIKGSAWGVDL